MKPLKKLTQYTLTAVTSVIILVTGSTSYTAEAATGVDEITIRGLADNYFNSTISVWDEQINLIQSSASIKETTLNLKVAENIYLETTNKVLIQKKYVEDRKAEYSIIAREIYQDQYEASGQTNVFEAFGKGPTGYVEYSEDKEIQGNIAAAVSIEYNISLSKYAELQDKQIEALKQINFFRNELDAAEEKYLTDVDNLGALKDHELDSFIKMNDRRYNTISYRDVQQGEVRIPEDVDEIFKQITALSNNDVKHISKLGSSYQNNSCFTFDDSGLLSSDQEISSTNLNGDIFTALPGDTIYFLNKEKDIITSAGEYVGYGWAITSSPRSGLTTFTRTQPDYVLINSKNNELNSTNFTVNKSVSCIIDPWLAQYNLFEVIDTSSFDQTGLDQYNYSFNNNTKTGVTNPISGAVVSTKDNNLIIQGTLSAYTVSYSNVKTPYSIGDYLIKGAPLELYPSSPSFDDTATSPEFTSYQPIVQEAKMSEIPLGNNNSSTLGRKYFALHNEAIYANGTLPDGYLCDYNNFKLRCDASVMLNELNAAYTAEFGQNIPVGNTYRTYEGQVRCQAEKGYMCATPGESKHGLGIAIDFSSPLNDYGSPEHTWMLNHAEQYGWTLPIWARQGGSKEEPWHWEFIW